MASPGELVACIAKALNIPEPTVVQYDRLLAENGLRSKGGRGLSAAKVTAQDAANLLIAILGSPVAGASIKPAIETCRAYGELRLASAVGSVDQIYLFSRMVPKRALDESFVSQLGISRPNVPKGDIFSVLGIPRRDVFSELFSELGLPTLAKLAESHTLRDGITACIEALRAGEKFQSSPKSYPPEKPASGILRETDHLCSIKFDGPEPSAGIYVSNALNTELWAALHYSAGKPRRRSDLHQGRGITFKTIRRIAELLAKGSGR